jgi:hypothetical protein
VAGRTNTEKIDDLARQVVILTRDVEHLTADFRNQNTGSTAELAEVRKAGEALGRVAEGLLHRVANLEQFKPAELPLVTQRIAHLEKLVEDGRTRRWQVWLAILGAALALDVALVRRP